MHNRTSGPGLGKPLLPPRSRLIPGHPIIGELLATPGTSRCSAISLAVPQSEDSQIQNTQYTNFHLVLFFGTTRPPQKDPDLDPDSTILVTSYHIYIHIRFESDCNIFTSSSAFHGHLFSTQPRSLPSALATPSQSA